MYLYLKREREILISHVCIYNLYTEIVFEILISAEHAAYWVDSLQTNLQCNRITSYTTVQDFLFICNFPVGELKEFSTELDQLRATSEREISQLTEKLETVTAERDEQKSKFDTVEVMYIITV